jgi:putative transposase
MARLPRLTLPGFVHHVIQRGNDRQVIVRDDADRETLLTLISENAVKHQVALHAYVLMDNHFHLLLTPETVEGVPQMMQAVGRRYVRYFNDRHRRTGTLWEGRYRSTLIQSERYLVACMAYLDLNPVRAGMVSAPEEFAWSSHRHYAGRASDRRLTPHALYWEMGNTPFAREAAYAEMVRAGIPAGVQHAVTESALHGWALGDAGFSSSLEQQTPRRLLPGRPGRPSRKPG